MVSGEQRSPDTRPVQSGQLNRLFQRGKLWQWALGATLVVLIVNAILPSWTNGFPPSLNRDFSRLWDSPAADVLWHARVTQAEFARRPVVTTLQEGMHLIGIPSQLSFNLINYTALFFLFLLLEKVARELGAPRRGRELIVITALSFSVVFAFLGAMHTYDDFIQYIGVLLALWLLFRHQWFWAAVFLGIAAITRETSLLFVPLCVAYQWRFSTSKGYILIWLLPLIVFAAWLISMDREVLSQSLAFTLDDRFYGWQRNFANLHQTSDTLSSMYMVLGLPLAALIVRWKSITGNPDRGVVGVQSWILIALNTVLVCIAAIAREARLFFLPMVVVYPLIIGEVDEVVRTIKTASKIPSGVILSAGLALVAGIFLYIPSLGGTGVVYKAYFIVYSFVFILYLFGLYIRGRTADDAQDHRKPLPTP